MPAPTKFHTWDINEEVKIHLDGRANEAKPTTVIKMFRDTLDKHGHDVALNYKEGDTWKSLTYQQYYDMSVLFGKACLRFGMQRFQGVSIIGFNSPEWVIANMGAIFAGGVSVGIYSTNNAPACEYIAGHSDSAIAVCDGLRQLEKFLAIEKNLPKLKAIVVYNEKQVPKDLHSQVPVYTFDDFLASGATIDDSKMQRVMDEQKPGHCCTLIYTSGTTGNPKGVMLSHDAVTWTSVTAITKVENHLHMKASNAHKLVSFLPMSHVAAQVIDIYVPLCTGVQVFFAQPDALKGSLAKTLKEVRPSFFFAVPRVYEKIAEKMWSVSEQTTGLKKRLFQWATGKGQQKMAMDQFGASGGAPCGYNVAHYAVLGKIKEALGLDQCLMCLTGAAPITRQTLEYFGSLDIPIYELYGMSESTGPQCFNAKDSWKLGSCGRAMPGCELASAPETNELIARGRHVMMGYLKNESETKINIDEDGWLHTGDTGKVDEDGFVYITGRLKELIITAGGENIPPVLLEDTIRAELPVLSNVMAIGDQRKFLTALFSLRVKFDAEGLPTNQLDPAVISIFEQLGSSAKTVAEAKSCAVVKEYLTKGLDRANNQATSRAQRIGKFEILDLDFSLPGGELTPTLKMKRKVIMDKYAELIESMYA